MAAVALAGAAKAHRNPPDNWEDAVIRLAEKRVFHYRKLIERIRTDRRSEA